MAKAWGGWAFDSMLGFALHLDAGDKTREESSVFLEAVRRLPVVFSGDLELYQGISVIEINSNAPPALLLCFPPISNKKITVSVSLFFSVLHLALLLYRFCCFVFFRGRDALVSGVRGWGQHKLCGEGLGKMVDVKSLDGSRNVSSRRLAPGVSRVRCFH